MFPAVMYHCPCCKIQFQEGFFVPKQKPWNKFWAAVCTSEHFVTLLLAAVNGLLWDLLMWFEDMSPLFWGAERGLGYFQEDYMGWKRSRVEYRLWCLLLSFFLAKDKRKKGTVAWREREKKTGLKAQKHLCSSSRWFHFLIMIQTSNVARQVFLLLPFWP